VAVSKEVKVGLMALTAGTILYVGFNFLKGTDFLSPTKTYFAYYDNIDGLTVSNPVLLNGYSVGRVQKIEILQETNNQLKVTLEIDNNIQIGDSSKAILANKGLLDGKAIMLKVGKSSKIFEENASIATSKEKGFQSMLSDKATPLLGSIDTTVSNLNEVLRQVKAEQRLERIMLNFEQMSASMNLMMKENGKMNNVLGNVEKLTASLTETEKSLKPLLNKMGTVADSLNQLELSQTVTSANASLEKMKGIIADIETGKGTMGKLVKSDSLYNNMNQTMKDLDALFIDIKERPKKYIHFSVFGKKDKDKKNK